MSNLIQLAIKHAGGAAHISSLAGVSHVAVVHWGNRGLPRSDFVGKTDYAGIILIEIRKQNKYRKVKFNTSKEQLLKASSDLKSH